MLSRRAGLSASAGLSCEMCSWVYVCHIEDFKSNIHVSRVGIVGGGVIFQVPSLHVSHRTKDDGVVTETEYQSTCQNVYIICHLALCRSQCVINCLSINLIYRYDYFYTNIIVFVVYLRSASHYNTCSGINGPATSDWRLRYVSLVHRPQVTVLIYETSCCDSTLQITAGKRMICLSTNAKCKNAN